MIDVTLPDGFPMDLARVCQPGAKVYFPKLKQFGVVTKFMDTVDIKLDQGKQSSSTSYQRDEFLEMLQTDQVIAKSRVVFPEDENKPIIIKPRPKAAQQAQTMNPKELAPQPQIIVPAPAPLPVQEKLLTGYIDEKTGKFSKTLQPGLIEIQYKKVTRKMELELDSVQLQKLKELGIID
jgi:hypothetical protein